MTLLVNSVIILILIITLFQLSKSSQQCDDCLVAFPVDDVEKATKPLPKFAWNASVEAYCGNIAPEAYSKPKDGMIVVNPYGDDHGFVTAVHLAYSYHYPLVISPDDIWLCIVQGFAAHVDANFEKLRHYFVEFEGKKKIKVRRDDFLKGYPDNPWPEVFDKFSTRIRSHIGNKTHDLLIPTFTTTGPIEKAAAEIVMMNTFKNYFDYELLSYCGIPEIVLRGTADDWRKLRERALGLAQFELQWWMDPLKPILDQLVATSEGNIDKKFWSSIYKYSGMSGESYISGWIVKLFPYIIKYGMSFLNEVKGDQWIINYDETMSDENAYGSYYAPMKYGTSFQNDFKGDHYYDEEMSDENDFNYVSTLTSSSLPPGVSLAPFTWKYYYEEFKMGFYAGFMGVVQDPKSLRVSAQVGWAIAEQEETMSCQ